MKTLAKNYEIHFFRVLEINQSLAAIWVVAIQEKEKQLNLSNNSKLCGVLNLPILMCPSPRSAVHLKTNSPIMLKTKSRDQSQQYETGNPSKTLSQRIIII